MTQYDVAVVGAGVVGLATAFKLLEREPSLKVLVLEKEVKVGAHQTGHNSGVLHSGIYYQPGSLKAENCRLGRLSMIEFCKTEAIPHEICGKVIVAVSEGELPLLDTIFQRGQANGVRCELIDAAALAELEPHAAGIRAIHVPDAGIVDFKVVCRRLAERLTTAGATLVYETAVADMAERDGAIVLRTKRADYVAKKVVTCGGLQSDRLARMSGMDPGMKIVPFKGEYYELEPQAAKLVKNLIYPVPDPAFPFLGVHFTRMIGGHVECGPNAILAFGRECYGKFEVAPRDLFESLTYPGFLKLAAKYWRVGAGEFWRSFSKAAFVRALRRLVPAVQGPQLKVAPAGIRAQALMVNGKLVDDFLILEGERVINVCNAPSPAATSSLNIGRYIAERVLDRRPRAEA
ncbi:MAG: L-2-hydroxyglutarate oxidase [Polyangiaceae bacterium]|nr:L-2-hydroxyglutarate oxidase [Polyangiaceae bacterium]